MNHVLLSMCVAAGLAMTATGQDVWEWTSPVDGSFNDPARWTRVSGSGSAPPGTGDTVRFNEAGTYTIDLTGAFSGLVHSTAGTVQLRGDGTSTSYFITSGDADVLVSGGSTLTFGSLFRPLNVFVTDNVIVSSNSTLNLIEESFLSCGDFAVNLGSAAQIDISELSVNNSTTVLDGTLEFGGLRSFGTLSGQTNIGVSPLTDTTGVMTVKIDSEVTTDDLAVGGGSASTSVGEVLLQSGSGFAPVLTLTPGSVLTVGGAAGTGAGLVSTSGGTVVAGGPVEVHATGTLDAFCEFQDNVTVNGGSIILNGSTFASGSLISLSNGALWDESESFTSDLVLSDFVTVQLTSGSDLIVNDVKVGATAAGVPATVTLDGAGTTATQVATGEAAEEAQLDVGNATGATSLLQISNGASWETGEDPVTIGTAGRIEGNTGGAFHLHGDLVVNGTLDLAGGALTMDPGLDLTVQGSGEAILPNGFDHALQSGAAWQALGSSTMSMPGAMDLLTGGELLIDGGAVTLGSLEVDGGLLTFAAGSLTVLDDLLLDGDQTVSGPKSLVVGGETTLFGPDSLTVDGGVFDAGGLNLFSVAVLDVVSGNASADGAVFVSGGSSILVGGAAVNLGDAAAVNGFYCNGLLDIFNSSVTLDDANDAVFDSAALVLMGISGGEPGTLTVPNGLTFDFGANLLGFGRVESPDLSVAPLINNGHIAGFGSSEMVELTGYVKGVGTFDHVQFLGTYSPGFSPAAVNLGSAAYAGTLEVEIGGLFPGSQHDQLNHALGDGIATLGGVLELDLIGGFVPATGDEFTIITAATINGQFDSIVAPSDLRVEYLKDRVIVQAVCPADTDDSGTVDIEDLLAVLADWGTCNGCPTDLNNDGAVDINDLLAVLAAWGACD